MNQFQQPFPDPVSLPQTLLPPTSRYHGLDVLQVTRPNGKTIAYFEVRLLPLPDRFVTFQEHRITQGDRLDNLAAHYLGDPEQAWRISDANEILDPLELTETPGSTLRITYPEGVPEPLHA